MGNKPKKGIQLDDTKTALVIKEQPSLAEINITSDLVLYQALQRRALALYLTGLATYEISRNGSIECFQFTLNLLPLASQKISQAQILHADRQSFVRLSEMFTGNLKASAAAGLPLDPLIEKFETDMSITYYMLPIPTSQSQKFLCFRQDGQEACGVCGNPLPK